MTWHAVGATVRHPSFRQGVADMLGTGVGVGAWGLVTGVAMVKSGMSVPIALLMSILVYAGSAQLAVIPLLAVARRCGWCGSPPHVSICVLSFSAACGAAISSICPCASGWLSGISAET